MTTSKASWSRDAVIYQVYVRSFADSDGDGVGDLPGIASRLVEHPCHSDLTSGAQTAPHGAGWLCCAGW
jgi:hypothetical protein